MDTQTQTHCNGQQRAIHKHTTQREGVMVILSQKTILVCSMGIVGEIEKGKYTPGKKGGHICGTYGAYNRKNFFPVYNRVLRMC